MSDSISRTGVSAWLDNMGYTKLADAVMDEDRFPSADRPTDEEDQLKFYYVESIDDYWIGRRLDNFYYADWHEGLGFVWSKSRYLLWGEHIVDENTLWKEHTYPSEPIEIPFTEWIFGFVKKYFADRPKGKWVDHKYDGNGYDPKRRYECPNCGIPLGETEFDSIEYNFCPVCGADLREGKK